MSHTLVVGPALYVDKLTNELLLNVEVDSDQRRLIALLVTAVGEVGGGEALGGGQVGHASISKCLLVCWVSSLAVDPDLVLVSLIKPVSFEFCRPLRIGSEVFIVN